MFDLTEPSAQRPLALAPVGGEQGAGLDRVAERGAGAVRLDRVNVAGLEAGVGEGAADHPLLGGTVGGGEAVGGAVLVDRGAADHGQHLAAVGLGVGESLERQQARPLAPTEAVGALGERLAAPVRSEGALAREHRPAGRG